MELLVNVYPFFFVFSYRAEFRIWLLNAAIALSYFLP